MIDNAVEILGLTSQEEISKYNIQYPYKEFSQSYTISLVKNNLKIGKILKVFLEPKISEWKYIFTQDQYKIFMEGSIKIRILFLESLQDTNVYSTEINKIISGFLPVESNDIDNLKPTIFIEEAFIAPLNKNKFSLSLLIAMGTILEVNTKHTENHTKIIEPVKIFESEIDNKNIESDTNFESEIDNKNIELDTSFELERDNENVESDTNFELERDNENVESDTNFEFKIDNENIEPGTNFEMKTDNGNIEPGTNFEMKTDNENIELGTNFIQEDKVTLEKIGSDDVEKTDLNKMNTEKLDNNSISIDVEYDMNSK